MWRFGGVLMSPALVARWRWALPVLGALAPVGCVVGAEHPPSRVELSQAPSEPPPRTAAALTERRGCRPAPATVPETRPPPPSRDAVWMDGFCHSTSVQYEWVPGRWETRPPPYSWK